MGDEKPLVGVPKVDYIPAPVTTAPVSRKHHFRRIACAVLLFLVGFHLLIRRSGLSTKHFTHPKKGHHKFLTGKAAEKVFLSVPDEESCIASSRLFATKPHMAGTEGDFQTAKDFLAVLQKELSIPAPQSLPLYPAGSPESQRATLSVSKTHTPHAWIDIYYPVMNSPLDRTLQAIDDDGKVVWEANLEENADGTDPEAGKYSDAVPTFHGLSAAGDVTGKLIYANYGTKEDYDDLVAKGVNFTGSIVIARYGANFRGLKIEGAQKLGAAGVLIYSDPRDDGVVTVENGYDYYPNGPARNPYSVQRGSVQYLSMYPGDPTTPGYPAYENSTRTEGENIPKIPSLPISWSNAEVLLKMLEGQGWEGKNVRLVNNVDTRVIPIWNTMAVIPGFIKDEVVVVGNHRDAWVMGAADPSSGTASMNEVIRGLGELLRKGWKPLRTILIASWDAEEYGLIGSTEWGEDFAEWIDANVVAYLNLDLSVSGSRFSAAASPLLAHLVRGAAEDLPHPTDSDRTLWDATTDSGPYKPDSVAPEHEPTPETQIADSLGVGVLGSGSDFTVFLQRIGVASMSHGFSSTTNDAVYHYHSVYDSERWMEKYGDPGFYRHVAVSKHLGLLILRLADSVVLPLNNTHFAFELENYLDKVEGIVSSKSFDVDLSPLRQSIHSLQAASLSLDFEKLTAERKLRNIVKKLKKKRSKLRKLRRKLRKVRCRIQKKLGHPCKKHKHHRDASTDVSQGGRVIPRVGKAGAFIHEQREAAMLYGVSLHAGLDPVHSCCTHRKSADSRSQLYVHPHLPKLPFEELREAVKKIKTVNHKLVSIERGMISEEGIPEREWYRHLGVAPGRWLGYGATTLPALTESITIENNSTAAKYEVQRLKTLIDGIAEKIRVHN